MRQEIEDDPKDILLTDLEKRKLYMEIAKIPVPHPISNIMEPQRVMWRHGMFDKGRLAKFDCYTWTVFLAMGFKGHDEIMDSDEMKDVIAHAVHELRHMKIADNNIVLFQLTRRPEFIQHNWMGVLECEYAVNEYYGRKGAGQIKWQ